MAFGLEAQYGRHDFLKDDENVKLITLIVDLTLRLQPGRRTLS